MIDLWKRFHKQKNTFAHGVSFWCIAIATVVIRFQKANKIIATWVFFCNFGLAENLTARTNQPRNNNNDILQSTQFPSIWNTISVKIWRAKTWKVCRDNTRWITYARTLDLSLICVAVKYVCVPVSWFCVCHSFEANKLWQEKSPLMAINGRFGIFIRTETAGVVFCIDVSIIGNPHSN